MKGSIKTKLDELAYDRDGYKCVECGKSTGIEAHHIVAGIEELDNLITLCHACHKRRHHMAGCLARLRVIHLGAINLLKFDTIGGGIGKDNDFGCDKEHIKALLSTGWLL